jgi:transcriptional regulator with XRE-family HTH domain
VPADVSEFDMVELAPMTPSQDFAARLIAFRTYLGLSQDDLAEMAWGHRKFGRLVDELERGKGGLPPPIFLEMLAPALGIEPEELIV